MASTPRPSAKAARMMARPRIWAGGVRVAADGAGGEPAEDADADAGADDAERGEACAEGSEFHVPCSSDDDVGPRSARVG